MAAPVSRRTLDWILEMKQVAVVASEFADIACISFQCYLVSMLCVLVSTRRPRASGPGIDLSDWCNVM